MPSSVGAAHRTSAMRRPRQPQQLWQRPHHREPGRADRLGRVARRRPRPRLGAAAQRRRSRRRRARHRRASVGRMGSRRLLGRRLRSQAACGRSSRLSRGSESRDGIERRILMTVDEDLVLVAHHGVRGPRPTGRCRLTTPTDSGRIAARWQGVVRAVPYGGRNRRRLSRGLMSPIRSRERKVIGKAVLM